MISQDNTYWVTQARPWQLAFYTPRWWNCMWALMVAIFFIFLRCTFVTKRKWNSRSNFTYRYVFITVVLSETLVSVKSWNNEFCTYDRKPRLHELLTSTEAEMSNFQNSGLPISIYNIILISFIRHLHWQLYFQGHIQ